MTRKDMLENAIAIVTGENVSEDGQDAEDTFVHIAQFWSDYLGFSLTDFDVCMMMVLLKVARVKCGRSVADSLVDIAGYAACAIEKED